MFGNTLAIAWKEMQLLFKDKGSLAVAFLLPLMLGTMLGGMNLMAANEEEGAAAILLRVSLVNMDDGIFGENVADAVTSIGELEVDIFDTAAEAEAQVAEGDAAAAVIIPADFTSSLNAYTPTTIEVVVDPGQPEGASIVIGIMKQVVDEVTIWGEVQYGIRKLLNETGLLEGASPEEQQAYGAQSLGAIMTTLNEMRQSPAIAVVSENLEGVEMEPGDIESFLALLFAGFTVMFIFLNVNQSASSLLTERETGTLHRLLAAPLSRGAIIAGKMLAFMVLACLQVLVMLLVARIAFNVSLGQSPSGLVLLSLTVALTSAAMGMMVAALAKSANQASNIGVILGISLAALGGGINFSPVPFFRTEGFIGVLSRLTPHAHAVDGYLRLMAENATLFQILPQIGVLLAFGIVFFLVARWRFKFA